MKNHVSDSLVHHNRDTSKIYTFRCILFLILSVLLHCIDTVFSVTIIFYWSIVCSVVLVSAVLWEGDPSRRGYTSLLLGSPSHTPASPLHPSRKLSSLCYTAGPTSSFLLHMIAYIYVSATLPIHLTSPSPLLEKEDVVHIYNGILFNHKKKWNWEMWMHLESAIHS